MIEVMMGIGSLVILLGVIIFLCMSLKDTDSYSDRTLRAFEIECKVKSEMNRKAMDNFNKMLELLDLTEKEKTKLVMNYYLAVILRD